MRFWTARVCMFELWRRCTSTPGRRASATACRGPVTCALAGTSCPASARSATVCGPSTTPRSRPGSTVLARGCFVRRPPAGAEVRRPAEGILLQADGDDASVAPAGVAVRAKTIYSTSIHHRTTVNRTSDPARWERTAGDACVVRMWRHRRRLRTVASCCAADAVTTPCARWRWSVAAAGSTGVAASSAASASAPSTYTSASRTSSTRSGVEDGDEKGKVALNRSVERGKAKEQVTPSPATFRGLPSLKNIKHTGMRHLKKNFNFCPPRECFPGPRCGIDGPGPEFLAVKNCQVDGRQPAMASWGGRRSVEGCLSPQHSLNFCPLEKYRQKIFLL